MLTLILLLPEFCLGAWHRQAGDNFWWDGKRVGSIWVRRRVWGCCLKVKTQPLEILQPFFCRMDLFQIYKMQSTCLCIFFVVVGLIKNLNWPDSLTSKKLLAGLKLRPFGLGPWGCMNCNLAGKIYGV